jgi:hypothetical protein
MFGNVYKYTVKTVLSDHAGEVTKSVVRRGRSLTEGLILVVVLL